MGGLGEEHSVMKLVLGQNNWYSVPPMSFPRVQVRTMKKTITSWYFVLGNLYLPKVTRVLCPPCLPKGAAVRTMKTLTMYTLPLKSLLDAEWQP